MFYLIPVNNFQYDTFFKDVCYSEKHVQFVNYNMVQRNVEHWLSLATWIFLPVWAQSAF